MESHLRYDVILSGGMTSAHYLLLCRQPADHLWRHGLAPCVTVPDP